LNYANHFSYFLYRTHVNYILGKKVDQKTLKSTFTKLQQTIIKEYNLPENSTVDINKSLDYLKTLLKNEPKK